MKVDDDTFVNLPLLWDQLQFASKVKNLLMGHVFESSKRIKVRKLLALKIQNASETELSDNFDAVIVPESKLTYSRQSV